MLVVCEWSKKAANCKLLFWLIPNSPLYSDLRKYKFLYNFLNIANFILSIQFVQPVFFSLNHNNHVIIN